MCGMAPVSFGGAVVIEDQRNPEALAKECACHDFASRANIEPASIVIRGPHSGPYKDLKPEALAKETCQRARVPDC